MITVQDFKEHFYRDFPYLPLWVDGKAYFIDDIVTDGLNFYQSLIDANLQPLTDVTAWKITKGDINSYLSDADIEKAIAEARLAFSNDLFDNETDMTIPLLYLAAYYLVMDIQNSTAGLSSTAYQGFVASKSVGSVSESYAIPAWVNNDPIWGLFLSNGYGKKYLTYLLPRARQASIAILSCGATTI